MDIRGGHDAELLRDYIAGFDDEKATASPTSAGAATRRRAGRGLANDRAAIGMESRAFYGNVLFSTGPNQELGGTNDTPCHIDIPMRNCCCTSTTSRSSSTASSSSTTSRRPAASSPRRPRADVVEVRVQLKAADGSVAGSLGYESAVARALEEPGSSCTRATRATRTGRAPLGSAPARGCDGPEPEALEELVGRRHAGRDRHRQPELVLGDLDRGQRGHLDARRQHDGLGVREIEPSRDPRQQHRIVAPDVAVARDLQRDGVDHLDAFVLDVVDHELASAASCRARSTAMRSRRARGWPVDRGRRR